MAKTQVKNYVFKPGIGALDNLYPNAYSLLSANKSFIQKEATAWIQSQVDAGAAGFVGYTYNQSKCERDIGFNVDAYLTDLRYGGNEKTYNVVKYYWDQGVAQIDGTRSVEVATYGFIKTLVQNYILANVAYTPAQVTVSQTIDLTKTAESTASTILGGLIQATADVIDTGLSAFPTLVPIGVGTIKIQGRIGADEFLLVTNSARNEIIYNFSNIQTGGTVELKTHGEDVDFPKYLQTTDGVTTILLNYNTSSHSSDDALQIFVEKTENGKSIVTTRPYDFGTDSIERMRIAPPLSMLDADFEYGLQPTKWAAIGTLRGYPSVYEIPGTDTPVVSVTTDASFGNSTREWNFSVTNNSTSHWTVSLDNDRLGAVSGNDPTITITEGDTITFINNATSSHPLYIKTSPTTGTGNQVSGATNQGGFGGTEISWSTGLGQAGTYYYQCSSHAAMSGTIVVQAADQDAGVGQSLITVTTVSAHGFEPGTPITIKALEDSVVGAARAEGSFVITEVPTSRTFTFYAKAKVGTTVGEVLSTSYTQLRKAGFYTGANIGNPVFSVLSQGSSGTITTELNVLAGSTIIPYDGPSPEVGSPITGSGIPSGTQVTVVNDTSAGGGTYITPAISDTTLSGENRVYLDNTSGVIQGLAVDRGDGTAIYVSSVSATYVDFNGNFTSDLVPNKKTYTGVAGVNLAPSGSGATFNITQTQDPSRSYSLAINTAGTGYRVDDRISIPATFIGGIAPTNNATVIVDSVGSSGEITAASITGAHWDGTLSLTNVSGIYSYGQGAGAAFDLQWNAGAYTSVVTSTADVSENYKVGDVIVINGSSIGGTDLLNTLYITVTGVDGTGAITSFDYDGTPPVASATYFSVPYTYTGAIGQFAAFSVTRTNTVYALNILNAGADYVPTETFLIAGTDLGGTSPTNDLTVTIDNVGGNGEITAFSLSGTAVSTGEYLEAEGGNRTGSGLTFDISIVGSAYDITINNAGTGYGPGQVITFAGALLAGVTPTNNLAITIATVDDISTGVVTDATGSGTPATPGGTYNNVAGVNSIPVGLNATFDVSKNFKLYDSVTVATGGTGYQIGDKITLPGTLLDGASPANDILVTVDTVSGSGAVETLTISYTEAEYGSNFELISTINLTEATTGGIGRGISLEYSALATMEITFTNAHGLVPGDSFIVTVDSDDGSNNHILASGPYFATEIPTIAKLRYQVRAPGFIDAATTPISGTVYPRPDSFFIHRPFDGGVQLGTGGPQHGAQAIRQSKKYIRYQSGKGIMYTTGALFAPSYDLRSLTADGVEVGSLITVTTDDNDHGVQVGGIVRILGVETPGYNSGPEVAVPPEFDYEVVEVVDERTYKIRAQRRLGATTAVLGFGAQMSVVSWHGATVRSGIFDDQNGIFWEYDGTNISVNQRTGTRQLAGTIALNVDNNLVLGTNTRFVDQLKAGDRIVIKGMTHVVSHVTSQTEMTVTPDWRGVVNIQGAKANLIVDKKVKQEDFNLDTLDGTGPSGYDIDIAKMQMIGIQYSWYGAGFIDFMLRGSDGNFVFAHRMRNSNINTEAFMRSGNLPVRYEVTNEGPPGKLAQAMDASQTTIVLEDSSFFPDFGTVYINNEVISFTSNNRSTNTLGNCTRATSLTNYQAGATRSYTAGPAASHAARTGVVLISNTITPLISHWGSAFLTDGGFDEDRGYIFSYSETGLTISTTKQTAFMIRLAPSVSNALVGDLGERELLNRAQLLLQGLEITSEGQDAGTPIEGGIVVEGIINPQNYPSDPSFVQWSELSSLAQGGQPSFAQVASGGAITWTTDATSTTANITAQSVMTATAISNDFRYSNSNSLWMRWNGSNGVGPDGANIAVGDAISGTGIQSNTTVTFISSPYTYGGQLEVEVGISRRTNNFAPAGTTYTFTRGGNLSSRNYGFFTKASVEAANLTVGSTVSSTTTSPSFPANSIVNTIGLEYLGSTQYYRVTFNNSYSGTLTAGSGTVTIAFENPVYAQPGETVFSFIAVPGERSTLDLSELKELTNTPLGGRGTYPNGPDVLAINVYKVSGNDTSGNIIIKWGEAQA